MIISISGSLDHVAFERIIEALMKSDGYTEVTFDASEITFVEPYGLIGLITAARYCNNLGIRPKLLPPSWKVITYMHRMNFFDSMGEYGYWEKVFPFSLPIRRRERPLLELTKVETGEGYHGIIDISEVLMKRMKMMLEGDSNYSPATVSGIVTNIIEICQNLEEHSRDLGYVAAQKYQHPSPTVKVGIMDLGIGIANSLKDKYEHTISKWSDIKAIRLALRPAVSSRPEGGGLGLTQLSKFIKERTKGELVIRSGNAKLVISHQEERSYKGLPYFPGTQISMTIRGS